MRDAEFNDDRLVRVYDAECAWSEDDDWFVDVVRTSGARRVLDLGCGTGRLALGLAERGFAMTGVDPAVASITAARAKAGADAVEWIVGTSADLGGRRFEAAVMTSHVAQMFLTDDAWAAVLTDLHRVLEPGGRLAFDTRDPSARAWEKWDGRRTEVMVDEQPVVITTRVDDVDAQIVTFTHAYAFADGDQLTSTSTLRWRSEDEVRASLDAAGFRVEAIYGGWHSQPVG